MMTARYAACMMHALKEALRQVEQLLDGEVTL
jgi:hypothetical protein